MSQRTSNIRQSGLKYGNSDIVMKIKLIIMFFFIVVNLIACSSDNECFVADSVVQVKAIRVDEVDYFIYLRTSGFHEKEAFYELYKSEPIFNSWGKSNSSAISDIHIDSTEGVVSRLVIDNQKLIIVYSKNSSQEVNFKDVQIEVKSLTNKDRL